MDASVEPAIDVVILLGHTNQKDGTLEPMAEDRCRTALKLLTANPASIVVPTGGFGKGFNESSQPHMHLLADFLITHGIERSRILFPALTARTLEDALAARAALHGRRIAKLFVVTSAYHMPRTSFIFARVFPEHRIGFKEAETVEPHEHERMQEKRKATEQCRDWVDVPLIGSTPHNNTFPLHVYSNASLEQQSYDKMSYAVLTGQFVIFGFPYAIGPTQALVKPFAFVASFLCIIALFSVYLRMAAWANAGRRIMYLIEAQWANFGFSYNALHHRPQSQLNWPLRALVGWGIFRWLCAVTCFMLMAQAGMAIGLFIEKLR